MLAIVIPYYKLTFFEETLESLALQTNQAFKVYIGDDASPQDPQDLLEKYASKINFKYHKFETNLGGISLVKQWERCMKLASDEEWMMILGDDDVLENNCIAAFYENLEEIEKGEIKTVRFASKVINGKGEFLSEKFSHPKTEKATEFLSRKLKGGTRSSLSEYIFKSKNIETIKFKDFPLAWNTDLLAVLEFSEWKNIFTINEAEVFFRWSELNITGKKDDFITKNNATFQFYYYLLAKQSNRFQKEFINILFEKLEKTILDNKKNSIYWIKLFYLYLKFLKINRFLSLGSKIKKSIK
ncbi:glycosyltransferase family 2 protein [Flavobacterium sp. ANB]|uniref:glycosyltransferase family 2 protein n=1 Tax=unclassified Flavobacterium TaxID=196869 RepID=UPI0012B77170|nr:MULTISPECIES: glycosyltransferase family 2 protein [unclassified Flavobacterium]MBF4517587.1 glycosyltransferase family 2 protein [Flavobacterium sp. ANB]MTD70314.1 glycosyltransferase [Flavobacterium sp. LC2016-13]